MDLPRFNGEDPYGWLAMAEHYLDYYEVPPQQWVLVAACNFGADGSIWMKGFEQRHGRDNCGLFVELLLQRFGGGGGEVIGLISNPNSLIFSNMAQWMIISLSLLSFLVE